MLTATVMTNRGTAYIVYMDTPDAEAAISHMHEAQLDGAIINVSIVLPRRKFSRSPPPARRGAPIHDRYEARPPPSGNYRGGQPHTSSRLGRDDRPDGGRYRSPPPPRRSSPPRRYGNGPGLRDRDLRAYRPRSYSRSRTRSRSFSSRSRSRSPPRRTQGYRRRDSPPPPRGGRQRRSPSYSSFSSYSARSRSRSRGRYGRGR